MELVMMVAANPLTRKKTIGNLTLLILKEEILRILDSSHRFTSNMIKLIKVMVISA
jgi:hypothetical protein